MQGQASESGTIPQGPLVGLRVLDLGTMFAAPFAASLLGDFGAQVIKVELPGSGDPVRAIMPVVKGVGGPWTIVSRNKHCITLDMRKEKGKELMKRLVASSDVVIENFRPGTLENWGLGYEVLKQVNPRLILVRISGYGQTGPYRYKAGFGTPATAFSGLTYLQGYPDRAPFSPPFPMGDYVTGTFGALAAMMALYHLKVSDSPEGQQVDLGLYETIFRMLEAAVAEYSIAGRVKERAGDGNLGSAPAGAFQCGDGKWVVLVTSTDRTFTRLVEVMERPDLLTDPRFDTNPHRAQNRAQITAIVQEWFSQRTSADATRILDENGVPVCPIHSMADIFEDPQYRARENLIEVEHPVLGKVKMQGIVPKFESTPGAVRFPGAVRIGEHNQQIYQGQLGLSDDDMEALKTEGVI